MSAPLRPRPDAEDAAAAAEALGRVVRSSMSAPTRSACLIAKLRPLEGADLLPGRTPSDPGAGHRPSARARHQGRCRRRHGARGTVDPPRRRCRGAHGRRAGSNPSSSMSRAAASPASIYSATVQIAGHQVGGRRHPPRPRCRCQPFDERSSRRAPFPADRPRAGRRQGDPRAARHAWPQARRRHACRRRREASPRQEPHARHRALPSRRRGDGRDAICQPACRRSSTTRPSWAATVIDFGGRHDHDRGLLRPPVSSIATHRRRRRSTSPWISRAACRRASPMPSG